MLAAAIPDGWEVTPKGLARRFDIRTPGGNLAHAAVNQLWDVFRGDGSQTESGWLKYDLRVTDADTGAAFKLHPSRDAATSTTVPTLALRHLENAIKQIYPETAERINSNRYDRTITMGRVNLVSVKLNYDNGKPEFAPIREEFNKNEMEWATMANRFWENREASQQNHQRG